jgi:D-alanyl-D-alanine carboxypeptidase
LPTSCVDCIRRFHRAAPAVIAASRRSRFRLTPTGLVRRRAGLALFRYRTRCGTVYGHTGNIPGCRNFIASSPDGRRSVTVQASTQIDWDPLLNVREGSHAAFRAPRHAFELGVCSALA